MSALLVLSVVLRATTPFPVSSTMNVSPTTPTGPLSSTTTSSHRFHCNEDEEEAAECMHGECFVSPFHPPGCRCDDGYEGARCEAFEIPDLNNASGDQIAEDNSNGLIIRFKNSSYQEKRNEESSLAISTIYPSSFHHKTSKSQDIGIRGRTSLTIGISCVVVVFIVVIVVTVVFYIRNRRIRQTSHLNPRTNNEESLDIDAYHPRPTTPVPDPDEQPKSSLDVKLFRATHNNPRQVLPPPDVPVCKAPSGERLRAVTSETLCEDETSC